MEGVVGVEELYEMRRKRLKEFDDTMQRVQKTCEGNYEQAKEFNDKIDNLIDAQNEFFNRVIKDLEDCEK